MKKKKYGEKSLSIHKKLKGKISLSIKMLINNKDDLSVGYTPGVAEVCKLIAKDKGAVYTHTIKANTVAVISDGSAVLGLGNIGAEAGIPVMEGKAMLFKRFGGVDAFPICLATQDTEEIIKTIKYLAPVFGGINLEDISAPRCFEIEERLKRELDIPVFHDDQHGTAIVVLAGLINALKIVKKDTKEVKVVINGAGSAAIAISKLLILYGFPAEKMIMVDSKGAICRDKSFGENKYKEEIKVNTNSGNICGSLEDALIDADIFIGVSVANALKSEWVSKMVDKPIVFAMANPNPEISFDEAKKTKIAVFGTGRSDYPNQINNVLAFPGIFRGALDAQAKQITDEMKIASAKAIASLVSKSELKKGIVIPNPFNAKVHRVVAKAVYNLVR